MRGSLIIDSRVTEDRRLLGPRAPAEAQLLRGQPVADPRPPLPLSRSGPSSGDSGGRDDGGHVPDRQDFEEAAMLLLPGCFSVSP